MAKVQPKDEIAARLTEGREIYGEGNFTVQNVGSEDQANWIIVKNSEKGTAGVKEADIFDRWA